MQANGTTRAVGSELDAAGSPPTIGRARGGDLPPGSGGRGGRPPRIAMVSSTYYVADPRIRRQAEALVAHGYGVDVICQRQAGEEPVEDVAGVRVYRVGGIRYRGQS